MKRYFLGVEVPGSYKIVLNSDDQLFGGHNRVDVNVEHLTHPEGWNGRRNYIQVYLPSRTAFVYAKVK